MPDAEENEPSPAEHQIADILDGYRQELHDGDDPDPEACLGLHPELAAELADCLQGLAAMEELREALSVVRPPLQVAPRSLGDFQIIREIGRGGMGVVYEAIHTRINRRVALKMIKAGMLADGQDVELFRKEALAAASLHHPNIVQLFELGEHEGQPYLVLEFVDGGTLDARLAGTPIDAYEAAQLLATMASAIHYAHERGIVHRDLKPANVLLVLGGSGLSSKVQSSFSNPKITDFGLAKHLHADDGQTHSRTIKGTPSYMAPEQAQGGICSSATDVYSLGAILYETLTGRPPFRAATPLDTLLQVTSLEPVPPTRLQPKVPRDLETICLKCLHKDPHRRYGSALELAEELGRFLRHEPIRARPIGVSGRVWRWCRRNPVVAALLSVAVALTALVVVLVVLRFVDQSARNDKILSENVIAANLGASTILMKLWHLAEIVEKTANDPGVRNCLKKDRKNLKSLPFKDPSKPRYFLEEDRKLLQPYFQDIFDKKDKTGPDGKSSAFHTWHVVDKEGILLADVPLLKKSVFGVNFQGRDYFTGAKRHVGTIGRAGVHVSRAYKSVNDDRFKITLSAVVYDDGPDNQDPVGVVCATLTIDDTLASLVLTGPGRTAVLVGRFDNNDPHAEPQDKEPSPEYVIVSHPAYAELPEPGPGKRAVPMPKEMLPLVPQRRPEDSDRDEFVPKPRSFVEATKARHDAYVDPFGEMLPATYAGHWLAGFAPVGNMEMVVIVQQRREEIWPIWYWPLLGAVTLLTAGLFTAASWRLRHRPRTVTPPATAPAPTVSFAEAPPRSS